jgi:hypothetical protein
MGNDLNNKINYMIQYLISIRRKITYNIFIKGIRINEFKFDKNEILNFTYAIIFKGLAC